MLKKNVAVIRLVKKIYHQKRDSAVAEDLFHSSLERVILKLDKLRDKEKLEAWFKTILRNQVNDYYRSQKKQNVLEKNLQESFDDLTDLEVDLCKCSLKLLKTLKKEYFDVLKHLYLEGLSIRQTAKKLYITETAAKVTAHRAKEKLRQTLQDCCGIKAFSETSNCACD